MDETDEISAHDKAAALKGASIAHNILLVTLMATLREKGVLTQGEISGIFDAALSAAEQQTDMPIITSMSARRVIESIADGMLGRPPQA